MSITSPIGMKLSMYHSNNISPLITLKEPKITSFVASIKEFVFEEERTKVTFERCPQTEQLPNDDETTLQEEYNTYINLIKEVKRVQ